MSFTTLIKNEVCSNDYSRLESIAMLSGFVRNNGSICSKELVMISENPKVVKKIFSLFKELFDSTVVIETLKGNNFNKKKLYNLVINDKVDVINSSLLLSFNDLPSYFLDSEDLKRAYLRGVFLAKGSINDPKSSGYHLEFFLHDKKEANFVLELLDFFGIPSKIIVRDRGYMTYVKEAEKIGDFLRIISANNAILYFEDIRIYRDHKNMTNRLNNCEQANVDKLIDASRKQFEDINIIKENIGLDALDDKLCEVISFREKYPEVSLSELSFIISSELDKKITKSGLSHRFRKIHEIADKFR